MSLYAIESWLEVSLPPGRPMNRYERLSIHWFWVVTVCATIRLSLRELTGSSSLASTVKAKSRSSFFCSLSSWQWSSRSFLNVRATKAGNPSAAPVVMMRRCLMFFCSLSKKLWKIFCMSSSTSSFIWGWLAARRSFGWGLKIALLLLPKKQMP